MKKKAVKKEITIEHLSTKIDDLTTTVDTLAVAVAKGFSNMDKKIDAVESRLDKKIDDVEERLTNRITGLERRIDNMVDIKADKVHLLEKRVMRVEARVGIK